MRLQQETRSFAPRRDYTPTDVRDNVKLAAILNMHADQLDGMVELQRVADNIWRVVKWGTPIMIGTLVASGVVTGPIGKVLSFLAENMK